MKQLRQVLLGVCLIVSLNGGALAADAPSPGAPASALTASLVIDQAVHFQSTDGSDLALARGSYTVEPEPGGGLRLRPANGKSISLAATAATHAEKIVEPRALIVPVGEDERDLVLLLPDGKRLEAIGSVSGVRSRGLARPSVASTMAARPAAVATRPAVSAPPPAPALAVAPVPIQAPLSPAPLPNPVGISAVDRGGGIVGLAWQAVPGAVQYRLDGTGIPPTGYLASDTSAAFPVPGGPGSWRVVAIYPNNFVGNGPISAASAVVRPLPLHSLPWLTKPNGPGLPYQVQTPAHQEINDSIGGSASGNPSGDLYPVYDANYALWLNLPFYTDNGGAVFRESVYPTNHSACFYGQNFLSGCARPGLTIWLDMNPALLYLWDNRGQAANEAVYGNPGDLGVGRRAYCEQRVRASPVPGMYTVCYATAHGIPAGQPGFNNPQTITHPAAGGSTGLILAMVITKDASGSVFLAVTDNFNLLPTVQLDTEGPKLVPFACLSCHGGKYNAATRKVDGASFLPLDPQLLAFASPADQAAQEEKIRQINQMIYNSAPTSAIGAYILGLYNGALGQAGARATPDFVPAGWAPQAGFYRQVVRPYCALCHLAMAGGPGSYDFASWGNFQWNGPVIHASVCGAHTMPHNELQFKGFWTRDTGPLYLPGLLAATLGFPGC